MSTGVAHIRLSQIFAEEAAAAVAAAAATAAAASDHLPGVRTPSVAPSLTYSESGDEHDDYDDPHGVASTEGYSGMTNPRRRRASTHLIARNATDVRRITGESSTQLITRCCGGGCCMTLDSRSGTVKYERLSLPHNDAYQSLQLKIEEIPTTLTSVAELPEQTAFLLPVPEKTTSKTENSQPAEISEAVKTPAEEKAIELPAELSAETSKETAEEVPEQAPETNPEAALETTPQETVQEPSKEPIQDGFLAEAVAQPVPTETKVVPGPVSPTIQPTLLHTDSGISFGEAEEEDKTESIETETTTPTPTTPEPATATELAEADKKPNGEKDNASDTKDNEEELLKGLHSLVFQSEPEEMPKLDTNIQPPYFVQPHPPFHVYPARIHNARELTHPGAEKRTYHFDLDVTDYPAGEMIDFRVGGAIGVVAPNDSTVVEELLDMLMVPRFLRDKPVLLRTTKGRWPTVWGDEMARELITTRRDLLTWCSDVQSYPPTKQLLRILGEYATDEDEKKALLYLCSAEGQGAFCDFRTGPHISLLQMLHAFPSAKPPLDVLLSILHQQMPRFYSLSNDPHDSYEQFHGKSRRVIEIAVTVHESEDWRDGSRTGIGSGFFERQAVKFLDARKRGEEPELYIPMFKGLMANPLAKQFVPDGPMLLVGAGVGIAPFRGFVQRRLKTANCANKVWVLQGIRDSLVDELYSGEWGVHEDEVKRVVESRRGHGRYVQEEVRHQADLVWYVINSVDGRIFVCGSTKGMGEGVHEALIDVAMQKGNLGRDEAEKFWKLKQDAGQYTAETW